jgi:hypothetical protein
MEAAIFAPPEAPSPVAPQPEESPISELPLSPEPLATELPAATPPEPTPVVEASPDTVSEPQQYSGEAVFDESDFGPPPTPAEPTPLVESAPAEEPNRYEQELVAPEEAAPEPTAMPVSGSADLDVLADKVAERLVEKLSETAIKEIAWEVVPDLARTLIQKEIDALKAKIPK